MTLKCARFMECGHSSGWWLITLALTRKNLGRVGVWGVGGTGQVRGASRVSRCECVTRCDQVRVGDQVRPGVMILLMCDLMSDQV